MKSFIASVCIIILLCAAVITNSVYVEKLYSEMKHLLYSFPTSSADEYSETDDYENHLKTLEKLDEKWEKTRKIAEMSISHDETSNFMNALASAKTFYKLKNFDEFINQITLAKKALEHMVSHEKLTLKNILQAKQKEIPRNSSEYLRFCRLTFC